MDKDKEIRRSIPIILAFFILVIVILFSNQITNCTEKKKQIDFEFKGTLVKIKKERWTIYVFKTTGDKFVEKPLHSLAFKANVIEVGDSIYKPRGSDKCLIIKKDTSFYVKYINYNADDNFCKCVEKYLP